MSRANVLRLVSALALLATGCAASSDDSAPSFTGPLLCPQDEGPCSAAQDDTGDDTLIATAGNDGGSARAPRTHGCASKLQPPKGSAEEYATWQSGACD